MFTSYPDLLTIVQLKEMLGIGITLAYRLVRDNTIKALKIGREYKIPKANVISYLISENKTTD
ncbi:MAG: helix-turn-helix domain-containing protein [Clostridia bacterium]